LQAGNEIEIVVEMTQALRFSVRPAVDIAKVERCEPDVFEPLDGAKAEERTDAL